MTIFEHARRSDNFQKIARVSVECGEDFKTEPVRSLYDWWRTYAPTLPRYADFDIANHWDISPHLYVIQYLEPGKYLYRLNGEHVVEAVGISKRGHEITIKDSLLENRLLASYLDLLREEGTCKRCYGTLALLGKSHLQFESVDCPIAGDNGQIAFIIGAISTLT
ncbi:MAG: hypothetical protein COB93_10705 [Sneathiella sp.]|nr:MAG: hypothetical protein COB93_10705 [Sneathiella sp.]